MRRAVVVIGLTCLSKFIHVMCFGIVCLQCRQRAEGVHTVKIVNSSQRVWLGLLIEPRVMLTRWTKKCQVPTE